MHNTIEIIPGILEKEWSEIEKTLQTITTFANSVHVDVIDGKFVNNHTFLDPSPFSVFASHLTLEVHLMVDEPANYIESFADAGFTRFMGHIEKMSDQKAFLTHAKKYGEAGLALDGPTPLSAITVPLHTVDSFLIYTSEKVGFSGPPFLPDRLTKVVELKKQTNVQIEVDGGINNQTITRAYDAGATRFVSTSFLFSGGAPKSQYHTLSQLIS